MKIASVMFALAALLAASGAGAQPAIYDGVSGVLTIPSVKVGTTTYGGVKLQNNGSYVFSLKAATELPPITTAEGIWRGMVDDDLMTWIQLDNGVFYIFESNVDDPNRIDGLAYGIATMGPGTIFVSSVTGFDFGANEVMTAGPVAGKYQPRKWIMVSAKDPDTGEDVYIGGHFDSTYDTVPSLAELAGTYTGEARFGPPFAAQSLAATVHANGAVTGSVGGCSFAGTITPRSRGSLYDITVPFGAGCDFSGQTFSGIVFVDPLTQRLMVAALNAQRNVGGMFIATK